MSMNISVLVVTKNRSRYLHLCLQSLVEQSIKPSEVVVVDNASIDDTKEVIDSFSKILPVAYRYTKVRGYPKTYNAGLKVASGDWIIFLDDDCIATKYWFARYMKAIKKYPTAAIQGKTISIPKENLYAQIMGDHYQNWIEANRIAGNKMRTFDNKNLCIPRTAIAKTGNFNEKLLYGSEDIELGLRFVRAGIPIVYEPSIVAFHHERNTFQGFIRQHMRIAQSESVINFGLIHQYKLTLHIRSFLRRELHYIQSGRALNAFLLPFLYAVLAVIRFSVYYTTTWRVKK